MQENLDQSPISIRGIETPKVPTESSIDIDPEMRVPDLSDEQQGQTPTQDQLFSDTLTEWDNSRLLQTIKADKQERHEELLRIQQEKEDLQKTQTDFYKDKQEFEIRYHHAMTLIPMAGQLLQLGIDFDQCLVWIEAIHQCVEASPDKIDLKEAAYRVAQDLRFYRQFGGLRKTVELAHTMLNMFTSSQQRAIMTLMTLQNMGITEAEIMGIGNLPAKKNGQGNGNNMNMNGNSNSGNGSSNNSNSKTNEFNLDDKLISCHLM